MNSAIKRTLMLALCALALTLITRGTALAHDEDDYYRQGGPDQARNYGYENGHNDGAKHGRHEGREHDPNDYRTPDWRQATRGYKNWMGPVDWYQRGYQEGYQNGFREAYRDTVENDGYRGGERQEWRGGDGWRGDDDVAYRVGYDDGATAARSDLEFGKAFNSKPRGRYDDRDHGYRREYGSKDRYKTEYTGGYRAGYSAAYR